MGAPQKPRRMTMGHPAERSALNSENRRVFWRWCLSRVWRMRGRGRSGMSIEKTLTMCWPFHLSLASPNTESGKRPWRPEGPSPLTRAAQENHLAILFSEYTCPTHNEPKLQKQGLVMCSRSCCTAQETQLRSLWCPKGVGLGGAGVERRLKRKGTYVYLQLIHVVV